MPRTFFALFQLMLLNGNNNVIRTLADASRNSQSQQKRRLQASNHTSNYAIILDSSVFFHNYRHMSNALLMYHSLKTHGGFTDENIILFLGDEVACNARNPVKDSILPLRTSSQRSSSLDLYDDHVEVDYGGEDVTVDNFLRVLSGRHHPLTPSSKRLPPMDGGSNLFIYITGHGGDQFFKFRDREELTMQALRMAFDEMQWRKRYANILFITDTCQAFTLAPNTPENDKGDAIPILGAGAPPPLRNVYTIGSSMKDFNSYSHHADILVGHSVIDRYVHFFMEHMGWMATDTKRTNWKWDQMDQMSVKEALVDFSYQQWNGQQGRSLLGVDIGWTDYGCDTKMATVPLSDFMVMRQRGRSDVREIEIEVLADGVDFTQKQQKVKERDAVRSSVGDKDELSTSVRQMVGRDVERDGQESPSVVGGGTNPTNPIFVVSVLLSMLVIRYSTPLLW